jgi:autotransporter-associated beta strand protein
LQGNITNNASVVFDQAGNGTYAGTMSGSGTLTKAGAGDLTLSGTNSYSGGTIVTSGTLLFGADANLERFRGKGSRRGFPGAGDSDSIAPRHERRRRWASLMGWICGSALCRPWRLGCRRERRRKCFRSG